jgi:hypothetical protein
MLMRSYGWKLVTLLNKGWKGPHGFYVRWIIKGEALGWLGSPFRCAIEVPSNPGGDQTHRDKVPQPIVRQMPT